jgi:Flp pilus assembly protein TadB
VFGIDAPGAEHRAMVENTQEWLLRRTISSWKRVRYAGLILLASIFLIALVSQLAGWLAIAVFVAVTAPSFWFLFGSLTATMLYKMSGGFPQNDRFFGEKFPLVILVVREAIPGGREPKPKGH